jgi:predicted nucleotidyltransferase
VDERLEPKLATALRKAIKTFEAEGIKYALIGGIAAVIYGSERSTMDVDLLFALEKIRLPQALRHFKKEGFEFSEKEVLQELSKDGLSHIKYADITIDLLIPILPFFQMALNRAKKIALFDFEAFVVTPQDLIVFKLLSLRPEDKMDIEIITAIYGKKLDIGYIKDWLERMVPASDERMGFFEGCMAR